MTFTSRLTTGQFTTNPLGPNGLPAGNPVALPSATCCTAAGKSVWRRLSPAATAAPVANLQGQGLNAAILDGPPPLKILQEIPEQKSQFGYSPYVGRRPADLVGVIQASDR